MTHPSASFFDTGDRRFNLSESTVRSLHVPELLALAEGLDGLALDYGDPAGAPALRAAIAAGCGTTAEAVLTVPGTMLGLLLLAAEVCGVGGEALVVTPCFAPTRETLERAGARVRRARLRFDEGYRAEADRIAARLTPDTRLVCLASPQNPSGVRVPDGVLRGLLEEMARRAPRALLFLDETYREATHGAPAPPSAASLDPRVVTAGSLSKAHGAPGLRIGWLTVTDPALHRRLVTAKRDLIISGSVLDEALAAALLGRADGVLAARRAALADAFRTVTAWHGTEAARLEIVRPDAGALCCLRLRPERIGPAAVKRFWSALPAEDLRLAPGPWFGETRRVFRLGFGHLPDAELAAALPALSRVLDAAA